MTTLEQIKETQRRWADQRAIPHTANDYVLNLKDNFFHAMNTETTADYEKGDGCELGRKGQLGKLWALFSSSALVCNVFDYWRGRESAALLMACGISKKLTNLSFEQKFPTGLPGNPPNLDVLLRSDDQDTRPTLIESKFTEPYRTHDWRGSFQLSYFQKPSLWDGLDACKRLAQEMTGGRCSIPFIYLDAPQLLKHVLGLTRAYPRGFKLLYLWYAAPASLEADHHRTEIARFTEVVRAEVCFSSMTYQELFAALLPSMTGEAYVEYLRARYFAALSAE